MYFQSFGAADTVTGSRHLIRSLDGSHTILLDCGLFQGEGNNTGEWNRHLGFNPKEIDAVVLSHAHIDHCGALPVLFKQGYAGPVYSTSATRDLAEILLFDSAEIQAKDLEYVNKKRKEKNQPPLEPLYDTEDVKATLSCFCTEKFHQTFSSGPFEITFIPSGHIPGAASILIKEKEKSLIFSGDIGRYKDMLICPPGQPPLADFLIMESTYGGKFHDDPDDVLEIFRKIIRRACFEKKGLLIVPAFSVGRTQEILFILNKLYNEKFLGTNLAVFVDSPLASDATKIFHEHRYSLSHEVQDVLASDATPFTFPTLKFTSKVEDSMKINVMPAPFIVLASSGMMDAGRIKHHLIQRLPDEKNTVLIVNYTPEHSLGRKLLNGEKAVRIFGKEVEVRAEILSLDFMSAHADQRELLQWAHPLLTSEKLKKVFLVHGEKEAKDAFQRVIMEKYNKKVIQPIKTKTYVLE
ncbi:MAG: MBL fold metallo-hydrolase [Bacteroidia bacterium]|nr:MBL fold metallo-hydrolase [Bacteroidia bacterium]